MHVCNSIESLIKALGPTPVHMALGNFDGVHAGHQSLIKGVVLAAKNAGHRSVVVTFDPHPSQYFRKDAYFQKIDNSWTRRKLLAALGVDAMLELKFDANLAMMPAQSFLEMIASVGVVSEIRVGIDFKFGKARQGDAEFLKSFCSARNIQASIIEPVQVDGVTASSSQIRTWLKDGRVDAAAVMLGRPFTLVGKVVPGEQLGRKFGFPTANIGDVEQVVPGKGVYAGWIKVVSDLSGQLRADDEFPCVINVGSRPTVNLTSSLITIEAHMYQLVEPGLDFYGLTVELAFEHRLRDEQRFENVEALKRQIQADIKTAAQKLKHIVGR